MYQQQQGYGRQRHSHHQKDMSITSKWKCSLCTYDNKSTMTKCEMCFTPKPDNMDNKKNKKYNDPNNQQLPTINDSQAAKPNKIRFETTLVNSPPITPSNKNLSKKKQYSNLDSPIPSNNFNPTKPISSQTIFERWMISQIELSSGQQPAICVTNGIILTNLRRVRAPTTFKTIQKKINQTTQKNNNLDAGDWEDDEEEDISGMYPGHSPRSISNSGNYSFTPTVSDNETDININIDSPPSTSFNRLSINTKLKRKGNSTGNIHFNGNNGKVHSNSVSNQYSSTINSNTNYSNSNSNSNGYHNNHHNSNGNAPQKASTPLTVQYNNSIKHIPPIEAMDNGQKSQSDPVNNDKKLKRTFSHDNVYNLKKGLHSKRKAKKTRRNKLSISQLWFRAQSQLKQGRNPPILAKYNVYLQNIRQHNPRWKDHERRKSVHEKAKTYLQVTEDKMHNKRRTMIDADDDISDTDNELDDTPYDAYTPNSNNNGGGYME